jgi:hypothetical protein
MTSDQFICRTCGTLFPSHQALDQHQHRDHATSEPTHLTQSQAMESVNCPICGAQFSTADQMNRHARQEHHP